jgi:hypothetical protein
VWEHVQGTKYQCSTTREWHATILSGMHENKSSMLEDTRRAECVVTQFECTWASKQAHETRCRAKLPLNASISHSGSTVSAINPREPARWSQQFGSATLSSSCIRKQLTQRYTLQMEQPNVQRETFPPPGILGTICLDVACQGLSGWYKPLPPSRFARAWQRSHRLFQPHNDFPASNAFTSLWIPGPRQA